MTEELIARLRLIAAWHTPGGATPKEAIPSRHKTALKAADTIDTLSRKLEVAEKALKPFASAVTRSAVIKERPHDFVITPEFEAAREALATIRGEGV